MFVDTHTRTYAMVLTKHDRSTMVLDDKLKSLLIKSHGEDEYLCCVRK